MAEVVPKQQARISQARSAEIPQPAPVCNVQILDSPLTKPPLKHYASPAQPSVAAFINGDASISRTRLPSNWRSHPHRLRALATSCRDATEGAGRETHHAPSGA